MNPQLKILVVDDTKTMRKMISGILKILGFKNITDADDGDVALDLYNAAIDEGTPFDLVITDWMMPRMTGIQLVRAIKAPGKPDIRIIMVTAEVRQEIILEAAKEGVNKFIPKPFTPELLKEKMIALELMS